MPHFWRELWSCRPQLPSLCWVCHAWPSQVICPDCVQRFAAPRPRCRLCALPLTEIPQANTVCTRCQDAPDPPMLTSCTACVDYDFPWADCVVDFKFHQNPAWAQVFATLMRLNPLLEEQLEPIDHVLAMPLSAHSLQARGFNQALELARALSPECLRPGWLIKLRDTPAQSGLTGAARRSNLSGALALEPLAYPHIKGKRVLLVDDVMTTGTTLNTAAMLLRRWGALEIHATVFARTLAIEERAPG